MKRKKKNRATADSLLFGRSRLECAQEDLIPMLNVLLSMGETYSNIKSADGRASVEIAYISAGRAIRLCRESGIDARAELFSGFPYYLRCLLGRPGLIVGMVVAALLLVLGHSILWDVRVEDNENIEKEEVKALLAEYGVRPGAWISRLDIGDIQTRIELDSEDVAWLSINVIGTVAYVEVIAEIKELQNESSTWDGVNLVAERDGVIVGYELIAGEPNADIGQTVRKGELIVSGLYDSERFGYLATRAEGKVLARTEYIFEAEIPYIYDVREAQKSEICEISIIFFSFRQKFFKKGGFLDSKYDKIYSDIYIYSSGDVTLPIGLAVTRVPMYTESEAKRSPSEAVDLAYFEINRQILASIPEAEILLKSFSGGENSDGTAYRLSCRVECIDDIACPIPFYINKSE